MSSTLKIDWATHEAAKYAVENWHYSESMPCGKLIKVGAWENERFLGAIIFGRGANHNMAKCYNLEQCECCELVRIALTHHITPVSRIVSLAMKFLKSQSPGIRLIVSYADPEQGHHGGIYQAGNWIYDGISASAIKVWYKGKWSHKKTVDDSGINQSHLRKKRSIGKHRYLMPLDNEMKKQILPLAKPYPKRASSETRDTPSDQLGKAGARPSDALPL
jgi:hypothetical protein